MSGVEQSALLNPLKFWICLIWFIGPRLIYLICLIWLIGLSRISLICLIWLIGLSLICLICIISLTYLSLICLICNSRNNFDSNSGFHYLFQNHWALRSRIKALANLGNRGLIPPFTSTSIPDLEFDVILESFWKSF